VEVQFKRSGRTLQWTGSDANLLDFAERHGIAIESGCRSGSCGSCVTVVASGNVNYDNPPDYDLAGGQCLMCIGKPGAALVLEA
jgi:ferredoxin